MRRYEPKDFDSVFEELEGVNDRAAISVGGSLLEYALEQAILSRLREPQTKSDSDSLFSDKGILGTFYEKILAAYFLKIIGPQTRHDLDLIRKIRNTASHDMNAISFDGSPEVASRCRELRFAGDASMQAPKQMTLRTKFLVTVKFFVANLILRTSDSDAEIAEAFKGLAPFLDR